MERAEVEQTMDAYAVEVASSWERSGRLLSDLAGAMGVSPSYISRLRGRRTGLGLRSAIGLSRTLGATVEELERRALAWHAAGRPPLGPEALAGVAVQGAGTGGDRRRGQVRSACGGKGE